MSSRRPLEGACERGSSKEQALAGKYCKGISLLYFVGNAEVDVSAEIPV